MRAVGLPDGGIEIYINEFEETLPEIQEQITEWEKQGIKTIVMRKIPS